MITNFIFDLGNVLVDYNPMRCILKYVRNISDANYIATEIFASDEWQEIDKGMLTYEEALEIWKNKVPERLYDGICTAVENFHKHLPENHEMTEVVKRLKESGKKIYILSNVSDRFSSIVEDCEFMQYVDGVIISSEEKALKPEPEIYINMFRKLQIIPEESVFIDDNAENVKMARKFGVSGYIYDGDTEKLSTALENLGFFSLPKE